MPSFFSKPVLDTEFEAAAHHTMSRQQRACVAKSQDVIRSALLPGEQPRFVLVEDSTGSWVVVVTDWRLLVFSTSFSGVCRVLAFAGYRGQFALEVETNWSTRGAAVVIIADGFRVRFKVSHPAAGRELVQIAELSAEAR
ncbi:hypothetical protein [Actinospica sp.]|uniref:hypothetical protein n=1 Tax=Actinospica sp. TaxID=1872142 RepID=UPI002C09F2A0|nr:hypothetical protein [Actinospica sp.]HWG28493.1 hypothetical protein [Actinospica sp.]